MNAGFPAEASGGAAPDGPRQVRSLAGARPLSVAELNLRVAQLLERGVPPVTVAGEVSNFTRAASGHWYLTLKDARAQVRAVMFRARNQFVDFAPRNGDQVEVRGLVGLYEARGEFQLTVESMRRAGAGDLYRQFVELRDRLAAEGLFDPARRRPLPQAPRALGIVTSLRAAALRDVLATLARRAPEVPVVVYPSPVQGEEAPAAIAAALALAGRRAEVDVVLLVRGGGSIEDLWAFNDERVARAIVACPVPVVSGVGHETDVTIADFVADLRATTPTAAAEQVVPDRRVRLDRVDARAAALAAAWRRLADRREQRLDLAARGLRTPSAQWARRSAALEATRERLGIASRASAATLARRLERAAARLRAPAGERQSQRLEALASRLAAGARTVTGAAASRLALAGAGLELVSPRAVLARGFAIVSRDDGRLVRTPDDAPAGTELSIALSAGALRARVHDLP